MMMFLYYVICNVQSVKVCQIKLGIVKWFWLVSLDFLALFCDWFSWAWLHWLWCLNCRFCLCWLIIMEMNCWLLVGIVFLYYDPVNRLLLQLGVVFDSLEKCRPAFGLWLLHQVSLWIDYALHEHEWAMLKPLAKPELNGNSHELVAASSWWFCCRLQHWRALWLGLQMVHVNALVPVTLLMNMPS